MVLRSTKVVLTVCIIIVGFISACSDRDEKHREGRDVSLKKYTKKDPNRKEMLAFYDALKEISQKEHGKGPEGPEIFMHTLKPEDEQEGVYYSIGECFLTVSVDVDGDKKKENICLRYLQYKEYDDIYVYISLIVDLFKNKKRVLRQELDREFFLDERFVSFKDINSDGKTDLITKGRFSPNCAGCSSYRIYLFKENRFELALNLFNIEPDNPSLKNVLPKLSGFEEIILREYRERTKAENPCGIYEGCVRSDPWVVDSDHDGEPEVVLLVMSGYDDFLNDKVHYLFMAEFTKTGKIKNYKIQGIDFECCYWSWGVDILGFLGTQNKRTHLLINYAYTGNSIQSPVLRIYDIKWPNTYKIGELDGFYEYAIVNRLRDIDGDGNTEIIYVEDTYWPPGKSHAHIIPIYGIAEYREGRYVKANEKFKKDIERLNNFHK
jgi:hypothetical protein